MINDDLKIALKEYKKVSKELEIAKKKCRDLHYKKIEDLLNEYLNSNGKSKRKKIEVEINKIQEKLHLFY